MSRGYGSQIIPEPGHSGSQEFNIIFQVRIDLPVKANWFCFISIIHGFHPYVRLYLFPMDACGFPKSCQVPPSMTSSFSRVGFCTAGSSCPECLLHVPNMSDFRSQLKAFSLTTLPKVECLLVSPSSAFVFLHNMHYGPYQFIFWRLVWFGLVFLSVSP